MGWGVIRADASVLIGSGHIMRCLSLANALKASGVHCVFIARHIPNSLADKLKASGHDVVVLEGDNLPPADAAQGQYGEWLGTNEATDAETCLTALLPFVAERGAPDLVICDHYGLSAKWETCIGQSLSAPIAVIDDLSDREHDCKWLIDTTYGKTPADYEGLIPPNCQFMVGSDYALLRPEFAERRPKALARRDAAFEAEERVGNVLISMGGMDKDNVSKLMLQAIEVLPNRPDFETHVLVGPNCPHLKALRNFAQTLPFDVIIHGGVNDVTPLFMAADICIGAAGSSTWERCCLGLPTINIVIADNQKTIARQMSGRGALVDAGPFQTLDVKVFSETIVAPLLSSVQQRKDLSEVCRTICDGHGVERVVGGLMNANVEDPPCDTGLVDLDASHIEIIYEWQCDPRTRQYFVNPEPPTWDDHVAWVHSKIASTTAYFYIIQYQGEPAGLVRLDPFSDEHHKDGWEVSVLISPKHYGKKLATIGLTALVNKHAEKTLIAHVFDDNIASKKLFLKCGFKSYKPEYYVHLKAK